MKLDLERSTESCASRNRLLCLTVVALCILCRQAFYFGGRRSRRFPPYSNISALQFETESSNISPTDITTHTQPTFAVSQSEPSPKFHGDLCIASGLNPSASTLWRENSRALCLQNNICYHSSNPSESFGRIAPAPDVSCAAMRPELDGLMDKEIRQRLEDEHASCEQFRDTRVICAHGKGMRENMPECPERFVIETDEMRQAGKRVKWWEDITIVVPMYPYPANIYHYGNAIMSIWHVLSHVPVLLREWGANNVIGRNGSMYFDEGERHTMIPKHVNVIMKLPNIKNRVWQRELVETIQRIWVKTLPFSLSINSITHRDDSKKFGCIRNAIVLGVHGGLFTWPFPNGTSINFDGRSIPAAALEAKKLIYEEFGLDGIIRPVSTSQGRYERYIVNLPPLRVGYARRVLQNETHLEGNGFIESSTRRNFSPEDEAWFMEMLLNETAKKGVELRAFTTRTNDSLKEQVRNFAGIGFLVGIHGANLVNSMFMQPFGALFELFPWRYQLRCYKGGENSGLAYRFHEASVGFRGAQQECHDDLKCLNSHKQKPVIISAKGDKDAVRKQVVWGIRYLIEMHRRFPDGFVVSYDSTTGYYQVER